MALTTNLISYWKLDESSGNAADSVGSNTLTNTNTVTYSAGLINNGANFASASSQYFVAPSFNISAAFSVSLWFKKVSATGNYFYFSSPTASSSACIEILDGGDGKIHYSNFLVEIIASTTTTSGTWNHCVVTNDGSSNGIIYLNGSSVATGTVAHVSSTQTYNLGRRSDNNSSFLNGSLDEVGVWSRVLTSTEVTQLYNGGSGLQYPFILPTPSNSLLLVSD